MPNIGAPELILVLVAFILLFGAKKLPDLADSVGKSIKSFKRGIAEADAEDEEAKPAEAKKDPAELPAGSVEKADSTSKVSHER